MNGRREDRANDGQQEKRWYRRKREKNDAPDVVRMKNRYRKCKLSSFKCTRNECMNKDCVAETTERNIKNRTNRKRTALGRLCAERKGQTKLVSCSGEPKSKRYGMACVCSGIVHDEYRIVYDRYRQTLVIAKTKLFIVQESSTPFHLHSFACHIAFKRFTNNYKQHSMLRDWRRWWRRARGLVSANGEVCTAVSPIRTTQRDKKMWIVFSRVRGNRNWVICMRKHWQQVCRKAVNVCR